MDLLIDVERLASANETIAQEAMGRITPRIQQYLERYLRGWLSSYDERQDVTTLTLEKIWGHRKEYVVPSEASFWSLVSTISRRCAIDQLRKPVPEPLPDELPQRDRNLIERVCEAKLDLEAITRAADELWLKVNPALSPAERELRVLAVQLFYFHQLPWAEVAESVGLTRQQRPLLDEWLSDRGTCLVAIYRQLYWEPARLAEHLQKEAQTSDPDLEQAIELRYRFSLDLERILERHPDLDRAALEECFAACRQQLPFTDAARRCLQSFQKRSDVLQITSTPDPWKRLAFQYHNHCDLSYALILERSQDPAAVMGYTINLNILTAWFGNRRLIDQISRHLGREEVGF